MSDSKAVEWLRDQAYAFESGDEDDRVYDSLARAALDELTTLRTFRLEVARAVGVEPGPDDAVLEAVRAGVQAIGRVAELEASLSQWQDIADGWLQAGVARVEERDAALVRATEAERERDALREETLALAKEIDEGLDRIDGLNLRHDEDMAWKQRAEEAERERDAMVAAHEAERQRREVAEETHDAITSARLKVFAEQRDAALARVRELEAVVERVREAIYDRDKTWLDILAALTPPGESGGT